MSQIQKCLKLEKTQIQKMSQIQKISPLVFPNAARK